MEGGNSSTSELLAYLSANQVTIENWVSNGGNLFINYASNELSGPSNLGFGGVTSTRLTSGSGTVTVPAHPIFNGPNVPATGSFTGSSFVHNYITNGGITLITDANGNPSVTELSFGTGTVMFGGLTAPFIGQHTSWGPVPNQENMFHNLIEYLSNVGGPVSNDPGNCDALVTVMTPVLDDNCTLVTATNDYNGTSDATDTYPVGTTTVVWTVTDANGNTSQCSQDVVVEDNELPNAICQPITVQLDVTGNASITAANVDGGSTDNCGIASMSIDITSFTCANVGNNNVTLTVNDVNGNSSTCVAVVTVEDIDAPTVICNDFTVVMLTSGEIVTAE